MHKSRALLATLMLAALSFTGCSSITDMFSDFTDTSSEWTSEDSGSAISTLNRYTDLINGVHEQMLILDSDTAYFESDIDSEYEPYFTCTFNIYDRAGLESDTMNPIDLEGSEGDDLIAQATAIFATVDEAAVLCKDLAKYVTAQDYYTDDFAKGITLVADLYDTIDTYYDQHGKMLDTLDTLYTKYDTFTVDSSDPTSVGIDNMNKDLDMADAILTLIEDSAYEGTFDVTAELQSSYETLEASLAAHSGDNTPDMDMTYAYDYTDFYNTMDVTFLPTVKRSIRDMESQDLDALTTDYYDVLDGYNSMVDSYNYFLDATGY